MGIIVDGIIIAIIILSTWLAYRKGIVELAIQLCTFVIAIVVTLVLYQPIANLIIHTTSIDETVENAIYEKANDVMQNNKSDMTMINDIVETTKNEMLPETARSLAINIVTGGVMIVLFVVVKIVLRFVTLFANAIAKLPILKQINQTGGILYGVIRGIIMVYAVLLIISIPAKINENNTIYQNIKQSSLGKVMYENNILNIFFH